MSFLSHYPHIRTVRELAKKKKVKVHLVGGFLRDALISRPCMDFDFAVEKNAVALAKDFADAVKGAFVLLDEENGCARVVKKTPRGTEIYDFADYRAKTLEKDLARRDFVLNTLIADIGRLADGAVLAGVILDPLKARKDIAGKIIRMTSAKAFKDDPLRLLRAYSLRAQLDFKIAAPTLAQIKKNKQLIHDVSAERVRDELFKIFSAADTGGILKEMDRDGLLAEVIPQIRVMYKVKQGGYHHLDVWKHSLEAVVQLDGVLREFADDKEVREYLDEEFGGHKRFALIKLAMLLHDIGKPQTKKKEKDRFSFHGHEHVGRDICRHIAKMLKLSTDERYKLEDMVRWHLRPGYLGDFKTKPTARAIFRYFRDTKDEGASILILSIADQRATRGPMTTKRDEEHHVKTCRMLIKKFFEKRNEKPIVRLVTGHDLIKKLKLTPSPLFAKILSAVEEKQALGKVTTREEALALAKRIAKCNENPKHKTRNYK